MFLDAAAAQALADKILSRSKADACAVKIDGGEDNSLRFARGTATTNLTTSDLRLNISAHIGGRIGAVTTTQIDDDALTAAVRRSEELAAILPVDPDYIPPPGPQDYEKPQRFHDQPEALRLDALATKAAQAIAESAQTGVDTFGCANGAQRFEALATSAGLFAYEPRSEIDLSVTARNRADNWSGWAGAHNYDATRLDAQAIARRACEKAAWNAEPVDLEPDAYTVILEPEATAELAYWLLSAMDARVAEEGRSFFSKAGGGSLIGERLFDPRMTLRIDPADMLAPEGAFDPEGLPHRRRAFIDKGVATTLHRSRVWAQKTHAPPIPYGHNFILDGGATTREEMIRSTKRGVLITRLWYTNMVEPKSLLLTGLTRDGNFLIENGRIVTPARNMRFNQRLGELFARLIAIGPTERTWRAAGDGAPAAPPIMVENFIFSSKSSGI
jgi:predicted Zn-dependent protease